MAAPLAPAASDEPRPASPRVATGRLLEARARSKRDALERCLREHDRHTGLGCESAVDSTQERSAAREHDPAAADVCRQLRWGGLERTNNGFDDRADRRVERV